MILPLEIRLLAVKASVKNSCENMGSLSEEKPNLLKSTNPTMINRIVFYVIHSEAI